MFAWILFHELFLFVLWMFYIFSFYLKHFFCVKLSSCGIDTFANDIIHNSTISKQQYQTNISDKAAKTNNCINTYILHILHSVCMLSDAFKWMWSSSTKQVLLYLFASIYFVDCGCVCVSVCQCAYI